MRVHNVTEGWKFPTGLARHLVLALVVLVAGTQFAEAAGCTRGFRFCDNCDTVLTFRTKKNKSCRVRYSVATGAVFSQTVTKRPRGVYGLAHQTSAAYQPPPNFVGDDYFEVTIRYDRSSNHYVTTLKVTVKVTE